MKTSNHEFHVKIYVGITLQKWRHKGVVLSEGLHEGISGVERRTHVERHKNTIILRKPI